MSSGEQVAYMCLTEWEHEFGAADDACRVFSTLEDLQKNLGCAKSCGVMQVFIRPGEVVIPADHSADMPGDEVADENG